MTDSVDATLVGVGPAKMTDTKNPNAYSFEAWGKLSRDESGQLVGTHPLLDHMTDVAECFLALARCAAVRRCLERTAGRALDDADLQRLAVLAFLHDIGKANSGFQSRRWKHPETKVSGFILPLNTCPNP